MKYAIRASETVYYYIEIDADSPDDAIDKARDYTFTNDDIVDGDYFDIYDVIAINDTVEEVQQ